MNILIVDDDVIDRRIIKRALLNNNNPCNLQGVSSVEKGIKAINHEFFDVLLLDYRMPRVNGIAMVRELRNRPDLGGTAIIMMSSSDDEELALACLEAGAQDFIVKSEITATKLKRSILQSKKRFQLEKKLYDSYYQVRQLAEKDTLTGISNRYHFEKSFKACLSNNLQTQGKMALLMLDLDHFKNVNDSHGHEIGDQLIKKVTNVISHCLSDNEIFGRLGGDEFAILLTKVAHTKDVNIVAKNIIKSLQDPIVIEGISLKCSVSIGISTCPENSDSAKVLMKYSDIAMYRAKQLGRNQLCFFESVMQNKFLRHHQIQTALQQANINEDFQLLFQPVINISNKEITGVEALIRWPNTEIDTSPDEFIPIAEEIRIIDKIGAWVINSAVQQLSVWQKNFNTKLTMAINISAVQLRYDSFVPMIQFILNKYNVNAEDIIFEITEAALINQQDEISQRISQLYELGCKLALDDFGTGFSSLSHLLDYPIDIVKLDKSLLPNSATDLRHISTVKGFMAMARTIGLHVIAEGIETQFQSDLCTDLQIDELQGYFYDKPLPATEIEQKWLKNKV